MPREIKNYKSVSFKLNTEVLEMLEEIVRETSLSKTAATERAIKLYYQNYKETGKV